MINTISFSLQTPTYTRPRIMSAHLNGENLVDLELRSAFDEIPKHSLTPVIENSKNIEKIDANIIPGRVSLTKTTSKVDKILDSSILPLDISENSNDEEDEDDKIIQQITKNRRKSSSIPPTLKIQKEQYLPHLLIVFNQY